MAHRICRLFVIALVSTSFLACSNGQNGKARTGKTTTPADSAKRPRLKRASPLPKLARQLLNKRMHRHGEQMEKLLWAALSINRPMVKSLAQAIADEPRISKPSSNDLSTLNHVFPKQFFALQEELRSQAVLLVAAADKSDDTAMAEAYGKLAQTCVRCHSLYLTFPVKK